MSDDVSFKVTARDPTAEIFLIDGNFALVDRGVGAKTFAVAPGIYKIKQRAANVTDEALYAIRPGMKDIDLPPVRFASPIPLNETAKSHEFHQAAVSDAASRLDDGQGKPGGIVLVARNWTAADSANFDPNIYDPSRGLRLRDFAGNVVVDFEKDAKKNLGTEPCATFHTGIEPGAYRLTLDRPGGVRVEQTIIAAKGWDTQIFLLLDRSNDPRADLVHGAITMVPCGTPFQSWSDDLRAEELTRLSLADGLTVLPPELRSRVLSPNATPMLALLGAHMLIREARNAKEKNAKKIDNTGEVKTIVENLRQKLGDHPDVEAIAIRAGARNQNYVFSTPPMLRESWASLLRASVDDPSLIPSTSFCASIANRIWGDGPWTLWTDPDQATAPAALWHSSATTLLQNMSAPVPEERKEANVVKRFFTKRSRRAFPKEPDSRRAMPSAKVDVKQARELLKDANNRKEVVRTLGIPISSVDEWLNKLDE